MTIFSSSYFLAFVLVNIEGGIKRLSAVERVAPFHKIVLPCIFHHWMKRLLFSSYG
jgi:hypothetical protein